VPADGEAHAVLGTAATPPKFPYDHSVIRGLVESVSRGAPNPLGEIAETLAAGRSAGYIRFSGGEIGAGKRGANWRDPLLALAAFTRSKSEAST
jgi:hypothetical protein